MVNITRFPVGMLTIYRILLTARKITSHLYPTLLGPQGQPHYQILWILPIEKTWVVLFWSVHNYSVFFLTFKHQLRLFFSSHLSKSMKDMNSFVPFLTVPWCPVETVWRGPVGVNQAKRRQRKLKSQRRSHVTADQCPWKEASMWET